MPQHPGPPNQTMFRRALFLLTVCGIVSFSVLIFQLFRLQILRHDELESAALHQQLRRTVLPAGRGTIYDAQGRVLAMSATTYSVYLSPAEIAMNGEDAEKIASGLAEILSVDREKILKLASDRSSWYKTVARRIESDTARRVRELKDAGDFQGIKLEPDVQVLQCYLREFVVNNNSEALSKDIYALFRDLNLSALQNATIVISIIPLLCLYPTILKYFTSGVLAGGVKE